MADKEDADRGLSNQGFITASSMEVFHSAVTRAGLDRLLLVLQDLITIRNSITRN